MKLDDKRSLLLYSGFVALRFLLADRGGEREGGAVPSMRGGGTGSLG